MPNTKLYDRKNVSVRSTLQGQVVLEFASKLGTHGWSVGAGGSEDISSALAQYPSVVEIGRPIMLNSVSADLSVEIEISVPTGKYWRLIGGFLNYTASNDAASRIPIITIEQTDDTALDTITLATRVADAVGNDHWLFGTDGNVGGNLDVASVGTLTIAEPLTAGDTFTIGATEYTFVAGTDEPTVANSINMGADEAGTKTNIEAMFVDGKHPLVNAVAFDGDDMVFTARTPGLAGDAIVFIEGTLTHASNVLDGSGVLGGTSPAAADASDKLGTLDYPTNGVLLVPTDKIVLNVTAGHANDAAEIAFYGLEFDNDPR
jgi:hypothetical protein